MRVTEQELQRVVSLLLRDIGATVGAGWELHVLRYAADARAYLHDLDSFTERVVGDVQQSFHDCRVDSTWPRCPRHPNHPMWYEKGAWRADGHPVAALGDPATAYGIRTRK